MAHIFIFREKSATKTFAMMMQSPGSNSSGGQQHVLVDFFLSHLSVGRYYLHSYNVAFEHQKTKTKKNRAAQMTRSIKPVFIFYLYVDIFI